MTFLEFCEWAATLAPFDEIVARNPSFFDVGFRLSDTARPFDDDNESPRGTDSGN